MRSLAAGDLDRPLAEFPFGTLAEKVNCIADEIEGESLRLCDQDVELYLHIDDKKKERIHSADEVEITMAKLAKLFRKKKARSQSRKA